ncbi:MAG: protein-glutamate O-methyltransferase CheR [Pirellulaceae bacterium]|nr:protein-glutamate O-methyltransferase CheR [Pirellulaceae bacterium]
MELTRAAFDDLRRSIHRLCGIVLTDDKEYLIRHRLEPVARRCGCRSFDEFRTKLAGSEAARLQEAVIEAITTRETAFFRDHHPFQALRQQILPELVRNRRNQGNTTGRPIRIWCAGAATGQEPYSLAILIHELAAASGADGSVPVDFSILATDVSTEALAAAKTGAYQRRQVERGLTAGQLHKYFEPCGDRWVVRPMLRKLVEFRRVNLIQPFNSLGVFDAILCRNVLIYFDEATRRAICGRFHAMLADGGWLLLGSAESLYGVSEQFASVRFGDSLVYRKTS